ncbi:BPSS1780 family membrane protein [Paucibacter sp. XJ19-41]|uniref:BPSS1780 family membrane protein n=1 Tax=Paucibacter sp. XJ19-41 TaxID=2927824 RepID=UPI002349EED3|nr:BPSS1780 family membrane protein [Paucibacter sp. XJ19-41]
MSMLLHLQTVPARNGLLWVRHGFKVFQRKPLAISGLFAMFLFAGFALLLLPVLGSMLLLMALPLLSLGFMLATHLVLQNQTPTAAVFIAPLKLTPQRRNTQLALCGAYALTTVLIMLLSNWVDGGAFEALQQLLAKPEANDPAYEKAVEAALAEPSLMWGMMTRLGLAALLSVPFWHAPALVHWGGQGALQALFSSTLGIWRNKAAFALNALVWAGLVVGLALLVSLVVSLLGLGQLLPMLALPLGLFLSSVFYASLYFTFVDCFMFGAPRELPGEKA